LVSFFGMPFEDVDQLTRWVHAILDDTPIRDTDQTARLAEMLREGVTSDAVLRVDGMTCGQHVGAEQHLAQRP
jgi:cytochrome P450